MYLGPKLVIPTIFVLLSVIARSLVDASTAERGQSLIGNDGSSDLDPVWSPDGHHIVFSSDRAGD